MGSGGRGGGREDSVGGGGGGQGACERRFDVIVKIQNKKVGGVRSGMGGGRVVGLGLVEGWGLVGSKVGGKGDVGYGGCEPRKEDIVLYNVHKGIVQY